MFPLSSSLIDRTLRVLAVTGLSILVGCATRYEYTDADRAKDRLDQCVQTGGTCYLDSLPQISLELLRRKNMGLRLDCGLDFVDMDEATARADCQRNVEAAVQALVARFPQDLAPIEAEGIRYELEDMGCITLTNGYCACTFFGTALVPLRWY